MWLLPTLAALLAYAGTLDGAFVFDDTSLILQNPAVKQLGELPRALASPVWAFKMTEPTNYYRPLPIAIFNLLWAAGGGEAWPFHLLNVLLHALNVALVALLVRRLARSDALAFAAALLFALHPLNTESVAWISCMPELLYTALTLAALLLHPSALALAAFALAMFAKETAIAVVPLVFLLEWRVLARPVGRAVRRSLAYALAALPYLLARILVLGGLAPRPGGRLTWIDALANAPGLLLRYARDIALPLHLAAYHVFEPLRTMRGAAFVATAAGALALLAALGWLAHRRRNLALAAGLFLLPLLPVLYLPALGSAGFAEHYAYLPAAGGVWIACAVVSMLPARLAPRRAPATVVAFALALSPILAFVTVARNRDWHDNESLAASLIRTEPRAYVGHLMRGQLLLDRNEPEQALAAFEEGLRSASDTVVLETNVIGLELQLGRIAPDEAIRLLRGLPVATASPSRTPVLLGLGYAYLRAGKLDEAEDAFERALERTPIADGAHFALAVIASKRGDDTRAVAQARLELRNDPHSNSAWQQLGVNLLRLGRVAEAVESLEKAVAIDPGDAGAYGRLAVAYEAAGRTDDARRARERALEIDPGHAKPRESPGRREE